MRRLGIILLVFYTFLAIFAKDAAQPKNQKVPKKTQSANQLQSVMKMLNLNANSFIRTKTKRNETKCEQDFMAWLKDVKGGQIWALHMLDAQAKMPSSVAQGNRIYMGNFDVCLNVTSPYNFTGQYCLLSMNLTQKWYLDYVPVESVMRYPLGSAGICVPSSCTKEYVERVIRNLDFPLLKKNLSQVLDVSIDNGHCQKRTDEPQYSALNWFTILVLISIVALSVFSTIYEMWRRKPTFLSTFSLIENGKILFSNEKSDEKNKSISGYRAINSFLVVLNHLCILPIHGNIFNFSHGHVFIYRDKMSLFFQVTFNAVDSFLTLAGAMNVIKFLKTIQSRKEYDPVWEVIQRHIRFTIPIAVMLLIRIGISEHLHVGPIYPMLNEFHRQSCRASIFSILLGYDNFSSLYTSCFQQLWHISLDIQLFAFSQLILIAALWKKHTLWITSLIFCAVAVVSEFSIGYIHDLGPSFTVSRGDGSNLYDYTMPYTRAMPYFAGMLLGYFLVNFKDYRPNKKICAFMWIMALLSLSAVYFGIGWFDFRDYQQPAAAIYLSGHRVLWAFGSCWIIFTLYTNISGPLGKILSYGLFDFYGRISLEVYLVHFPLIQFVMASARETIYLTVGRLLNEFFPIMFYTTILAIILALFVTIPCNRILQQYSKKVKLWPLRDNNQNQFQKIL